MSLYRDLLTTGLVFAIAAALYLLSFRDLILS